MAQKGVTTSLGLHKGVRPNDPTEVPPKKTTKTTSKEAETTKNKQQQ